MILGEHATIMVSTSVSSFLSLFYVLFGIIHSLPFQLYIFSFYLRKSIITELQWGVEELEQFVSSDRAVSCGNIQFVCERRQVFWGKK
jgi:hypothetical protein